MSATQIEITPRHNGDSIRITGSGQDRSIFTLTDLPATSAGTKPSTFPRLTRSKSKPQCVPPNTII